MYFLRNLEKTEVFKPPRNLQKTNFAYKSIQIWHLNAFLI